MINFGARCIQQQHAATICEHVMTLMQEVLQQPGARKGSREQCLQIAAHFREPPVFAAHGRLSLKENQGPN